MTSKQGLGVDGRTASRRNRQRACNERLHLRLSSGVEVIFDNDSERVTLISPFMMKAETGSYDEFEKALKGISQ